MSHTLRSPSEVELQSLHLAFTHLAAANTSSKRAARPQPLRTPPAYISDDDLSFEPLEPSVVESEEHEFALKAHLALAAMSTPPASTTACSAAPSPPGPSSTRSTPDLGHSPYLPEREGYFSRPMYAGEERPSISPYGASSPALSSGRSSPGLWHSTTPDSSASSGPSTPPAFDSASHSPQPITAASLAQLNKASIKARGLRLPPRHAAAPTPFPSSAESAPRTPQRTVKGFNLDLGVLASNFEGISLASGGVSSQRKLPAMAGLDDLEAPNSPAFRTKPRVSQYAF